MKKKILLIGSIVIVLALVGGGYYYWKTKMQKVQGTPSSAAQQAAEDIQKTAASVSADVGKSVLQNATAPTVNPITTNANPYNKTNPYSNLKTNPFQ